MTVVVLELGILRSLGNGSLTIAPRLWLPASLYLLNPFSRALPAFPPSMAVTRDDMEGLVVSCKLEVEI